MKDNLSTTVTQHNLHLGLGSFALMFITLGLLLYLNRVNALLTLLAAGMGIGLLVWAILSWATLSWDDWVRPAFFFLLILMILLLPSLPPLFGDTRWWLHQLALVLLVPFIIFWRWGIVTVVDCLLVAFGLAIVLSMLMGLTAGNPPLLRDWFELAKPGFWWLILSVGLGCRGHSGLKDRALWIFLGAGMVVGIVTVAQYLDWGNVNSWLTPLFVTNEDRLRTVSYRAMGTFGNPNRLGVFMTAVLNTALILLLFSWQRRWLRWGLILYMCGAFAVILMAGSRFGFLAAALSAVGIVLIRLWYSRILSLTRVILISFLLLITVLGSVLMATQAEKITAQLTGSEALLSGNPLTITLYRLGSITEQFDSDTRRMSDWRTAWELGWESPIFGVGPSKGVDEQTYLHSEYLLVFRRYGFVGLTLFLLLYGKIALSAYRSFRKAHTRQDTQQQVLALSTLMAVLVFVIHGVVSNAPMTDFQLSAVLWWLIGMFYATTINGDINKMQRKT